MRVIAHIHTFNDADIIDGAIEAMRRQTHPVDAIVVVDNGSTDGTLDRPSLRHAIVLRHPENRGTSGTVYTGMQFAIEQGYDWIWVFDADSLPAPDALEKLLQVYAGWPSRRQEEVAFLACAHYNRQDRDMVLQHAGIFNERGFARVIPDPSEPGYLCHVNIWSGCLYRVAALRRIGLPNQDYVLDWGEGEYGYRVMQAGYTGFILKDALLEHNVRGYTSLKTVQIKFGPAMLRFREFAPIRCYYTCRNPLYFALYDAASCRLRLLANATRRVVPLTLNFLLRPRHHGAQIRACLRGLWDGVTGNIAARY